MGTPVYPNPFDRIRSFFSGTPAKAYATRRIAIEDLRAAHQQQARILSEDIELMNRLVNPLDRFMDGGRLLTPIGTILDLGSPVVPAPVKS